MASTGQRIPTWGGTPDDPVPMKIGIGSVVRGCMGCTNAAGYLVDAADTATLKMAGILNGGGTATANGEYEVDVHQKGTTKLNNSIANPVTQAHVGDHCYIEDNDTVASTTVNFVRAGIVRDVDTDGVWVDVRAEVLKESPELENAGDDKMDLTGMDADAMALTLTGAVGTVWDTAKPTTVLSAFDRIAAETAFLPGGPIPQTDRLADIYVDAAAGLDTNPGTAAAPVLTMDRAAEIVPPMGYCNIYVSGDPAWVGGGQFPYAGYRGHCQIIAVDALTGVGAPDVVAAYGAGTGAYGRDQVTPTVLVPADATDRVRFLVLTDDAGDDHIVKILGEVGGVWQTEPAALTITGANAVVLYDLTQTLAPANYVIASPLHHEGDVKIIGFNVTSPGADGMTGFGFAACVIDATADVQALNMGYNATLGGITIAADLGTAAPGTYCPAASLVGSVFETIQQNNQMPGCHVTMAGGASLLRLISASSPGCGRIVGTIWEAGDIYVGNPEASVVFSQSRGVLAASGLQVMDGAQVRAGNTMFGDILTKDGTQIVLSDDIEATSVDVDGELTAAGVGTHVSVVIIDAVKEAATSDTLGFVSGQHARLYCLTITGNYWDIAAVATPIVQLMGKSEDCRFTLPVGPGVDRGAGDLVEILGGDHVFGPCTGDNANVGGTGMSILGFNTSFSAQNGFAITGNGGGTTTVGIGSKGHVALPGAGTRENDFAAAGALTGVELMAMFDHRA